MRSSQLDSGPFPIGFFAERTLLPLLALLLLLLNGCASVPQDYPRAPSTADEHYIETSLGQFFEQAAAKHPGLSGFSLIRYGRPAYTSRIALADKAERTIDAQYYIWEADETGHILAERLIRAADRGVRVRVLVDDINLAGRDANIAAMDAHPHIQIRVFNPFANRSNRLFDFVLDLARVNHRMHNKILIVDNAVSIVGGRNIGNHYFGVATDANFRDLDIAATGPVVREISGVFDHFWNGEWAVPISALHRNEYTRADLEELRTHLGQWLEQGAYPYPLDDDVMQFTAQLEGIRDSLIWAHGEIAWDDPALLYQGIMGTSILEDIRAKVRNLESELLIESAYFVMRDEAIEALTALHERGVRVRVLTNSLSSNDVLAAHAGHARHRKALLESGVELYEYRADSRINKTRAYRSTSKAALHTKALVFDRESVFVGSFNLDPRSAEINTEAGLYVESRELAEQLAAYMDSGVTPENSYRVSLDEDGNLAWRTRHGDIEVSYNKDPESTFGQRFMSGFIMLLPIHDQL